MKREILYSLGVLVIVVGFMLVTASHEGVRVEQKVLDTYSEVSHNIENIKLPELDDIEVVEAGNEVEIVVEEEGKDNQVVLMFVGDIMLSRAVGEKMRSLDEWKWPFLEIGETLRSADLTFGNLECPISDRGRNVGSIYSFRADPRVIEGLTFAGFDLLSVANNHIGDWTRDAMEDTFTHLKNANIDYVGGGWNEHEAHTARVREVKGIKFGFLGYTALGARYTEAKNNQSGIAWLELERIKEDTKKAVEVADFIIVTFHFGQEYQTHSNSFQQKHARAAIDTGAKLVIGHHPHVVQEIEEYNGGYIAYSLGNFIFDQTFSKQTMEGLLLRVVVENGEIEIVEPIKVDISREYQAKIKVGK